MEEEIQTRTLAEIEENVKAQNWVETRAKLLDIHNSEVANVISHLPENEAAITFRLLPTLKATSAFSYFDRQTQESIIRNLGKKKSRAFSIKCRPTTARLFSPNCPTRF